MTMDFPRGNTTAMMLGYLWTNQKSLCRISHTEKYHWKQFDFAEVKQDLQRRYLQEIRVSRKHKCTRSNKIRCQQSCNRYQVSQDHSPRRDSHFRCGCNT